MTMDTYKKKYKEALERARVWKEKSGMPKDKQGILDDIFPELAEPEDEKMRKSLIILLQHFYKGYRVPGLDFPVSYKDMLTWLEKQGETYTKKDVDNAYIEGMASAKRELEKQGGQKPANTVEPKCEESKTKVFDAPTPFEDKLYAFVLACEILVDPSKREFILEHSQEILDAAREQIGKEQSSTWSKKDEEMRLTVLQDLQNIKDSYPNVNVEPEFNWLKSLKTKVQPKQGRNEEDDVMIYKLLAVVELYYDRDGDDLDKQSCIDWLKSLKQRIGG